MRSRYVSSIDFFSSRLNLSSQVPIEMTTPLVTATLQAAFLSLCSSAVATFLSPKRPPVFALFIFSILSTPPNYLWQQYIEKELPGYAIKKVESDLNFLGGTPGGKGITIKRRLNVRNTLVKVGLDQTIGALVNTSAYVGAVQLLRGVPPGLCWQAVKEVRILYMLIVL